MKTKPDGLFWRFSARFLVYCAISIAAGAAAINFAP
jgi:hypothetical protein